MPRVRTENCKSRFNKLLHPLHPKLSSTLMTEHALAYETNVSLDFSLIRFNYCSCRLRRKNSRWKNVFNCVRLTSVVLYHYVKGGDVCASKLEFSFYSGQRLERKWLFDH